jgi:hypothetical protein
MRPFLPEHATAIHFLVENGSFAKTGSGQTDDHQDMLKTKAAVCFWHTGNLQRQRSFCPRNTLRHELDDPRGAGRTRNGAKTAAFWAPRLFPSVPSLSRQTLVAVLSENRFLEVDSLRVMKTFPLRCLSVFLCTTGDRAATGGKRDSQRHSIAGKKKTRLPRHLFAENDQFTNSGSG